MSLQELKSNMQQAKKIVLNIEILLSEYSKSQTEEEQKFYNNAINSSLSQLAILNNSIPTLLDEIKVVKPLPSISDKIQPQITEQASKRTIIQIGSFSIKKEDKEKMLKELRISEDILKKLKKRKKQEKTEPTTLFIKPSAYATLSLKFFSESAHRISKSHLFKETNTNLKKANIPLLLSTYISVALFTTLIVFLLSLLLAIFLAFFPTVVSFSTEGILLRLVRNIFLSFLFPVITFVIFIYYPSIQAKSLERKIFNEYPFAMIHMSAIAGSGAEPTSIFKVIAFTKEYPYTSREFKKIVNQINLYGYDIVTALKNVAKLTPSRKLSEFFSGMATTIAIGGDLQNYINKKAEDSMLEYRLERQKQIEISATFMDIYIGILVVGPLIFMLIILIMGMIGSFGISSFTLSLLIIALISVTNIGFIFFLKLRQESIE